MAYKDLSVKERHAIIRAGVANGIHRLADIEAKYDAFVDPANHPDYDIESYARENPSAIFNHDGHYPDTYKKPNHPTFSDESIYHSEATPGGHWSERNSLQRWNFSPSAQQISQPGYIQKAIDYLNKSESEGVTLTDSQGRYPSINGTIYGGVLPEVTVTPQYKDGGEPSLLGTIKHRLATNINPFLYTNPISRVFNAVVRNKKEDSRQTLDNWVAEGLPGGQERKYRLAAWSKYLGSPIEGVNNDDYITKSQYTPRFSENADAVYYTYKPTEGHDVFDAFQINSGNFTIGYGQDQKGTYYSLYDNWDINPFGGANSGDASLGIGNPFEVYDRIYYQDSPDAYNKAQTFYRQMLEEQGKQEGDNVVVKYKEGGSIHIAPSNPLIGKKYYKDGGVLEGDFDVDALTYEEIKELDRLGYTVERL